jgi:predicted HTH domain antitoxin
MTVTIPDEAIGNLLTSPEQVRLELAIALFAEDKATLGRAAKIAGLNHLEMQRELGRRRIPMHYSLEDYEEDMRTIREMPRP